MVPGFCLNKVQGPLHFKECLGFILHICSIPFYPDLSSETHLFCSQEPFIELLLCARHQGYAEAWASAANLRMLMRGQRDKI